MNKAYLKKVEAKVEEILNSKPIKTKKKPKGFIEPKNNNIKASENIIETVAQYVADIRRKRMELKNADST